MKLSFVVDRNKEYIILNMIKGFIWRDESFEFGVQRGVNAFSKDNKGLEMDMNRLEIEKFIKDYIYKLSTDDKEVKKFIKEIKECFESEGLEEIKTTKDFKKYIALMSKEVLDNRDIALEKLKMAIEKTMAELGDDFFDTDNNGLPTITSNDNYTTIVNPFYSEDLMIEVNPTEYYKEFESNKEKFFEYYIGEKN